ncbi:MAG: SDR family NAD(P)-dependent oxidoreductase, partial [Actinomycetota bacterium]
MSKPAQPAPVQAPTYTRMTGRRVFVTGAGSGIGRATALRMAAEGARVACADLKGAMDTAAEIKGSGGQAHGFDLDVTSATAVQSAIDAAASSLGGLDVLCNIAGIGHFAHSHEETPEWFDRIVSVNLNGTFYCSRYALPHLMKSAEANGRDGVIVNTASTSGLMGAPWAKCPIPAMLQSTSSPPRDDAAASMADW